MVEFTVWRLVEVRILTLLGILAWCCRGPRCDLLSPAVSVNCREEWEGHVTSPCFTDLDGWLCNWIPFPAQVPMQSEWSSPLGRCAEGLGGLSFRQKTYPGKDAGCEVSRFRWCRYAQPPATSSDASPASVNKSLR